MKVINKFLAIILLAVVATLVAVVSCKKETPSALQNSGAQQEKAFVVPEVDDMNAYLKDFKQRMQSSTRGDDETLSLEEAAWHLSSVANYDFGHVNVKFDDIRFDTLHAQVSVTNGSILLSDLGVAYKSISKDIDSFFQNLDLREKHFRFIDINISEEGNVAIGLATTFLKDARGWYDYHWYFDQGVYDEWANHDVSDSVCGIFSEDSVYTWDGLGKTELQRLLTLTESHPIIGPPSSHNYFVPTRTITFTFINNIDPYGSPSHCNSRLFGTLDNPYYVIPKIDMCYYIDSYLGLGYQYLVDNPNPNYADECPAVWSVICDNAVFLYDHSSTYFHNLTVTYCYSMANSGGYY